MCGNLFNKYAYILNGKKSKKGMNIKKDLY